MKKFLLAFSVVVLAQQAWANPVSFKDGWGIMPAYQRGWADLQVNYSFTNRYSAGFSNYYREGEDSNANFTLGQFNYLIKRWNELDSQANVYASAGAGGVHDSDDGGAFAGYGALEVDYETRRVYTLAGAETLQAANGVAFNRLRARAGIAPYKAPFDALQTWIVFQADYMSEMDDSTVLTPLLRFFYNNYAFEAGVSLDGDPFFAAMAHF